MGLSFFHPTLVFFVGRLTLLPCRLIAFAMLHFGLCSLGLLWACHTLSLLLNSCSPVLLLGLFSKYFGHPRPILILLSNGLLLNLSGFPSPITISFTFRVYWPLYQPHLLILSFGLLWPIFTCFLFVIIPMGLLLSLGSLGFACFLWGF